jgi:hypothetical protein
MERTVMSLEDSQLEVMVNDLDEYLLKFASQHKLSALLVSSVMLSRLTWMNKLAGDPEDFSKLLQSVIDTIEQEKTEVIGNLH